MDFNMCQLDLTVPEKKLPVDAWEQSELNCSSFYIAWVKQICRIMVQENSNKAKFEDAGQL